MRILIAPPASSAAILRRSRRPSRAPCAAQPARQSPPPPGTPKNFTLPKPTRFTLPNGLRGHARAVRPGAEGGHPPGRACRQPVRSRRPGLAGGSHGPDAARRGPRLARPTRSPRELAGMGGELAVAVGPDTASIGTEVLADRGARGARLVAEVAREPRLPQEAFARVKAGTAARPRHPEEHAASDRAASGSPRWSTATTRTAGCSRPRRCSAATRSSRCRRSTGPASAPTARACTSPASSTRRRSRPPSATRSDSGRASRAPAPARPAGQTARGFALLDRPGRAAVDDPPRDPRSRPVEPDCIPLSVMNALLGGSFASRITSNIREQKGYAYSPYSSISQQPENGALGGDSGCHDGEHGRFARRRSGARSCGCGRTPRRPRS